MADNIFTQLGKLFQSNVVIRKKEDGKLMVKDLDYSQTALKSNFIDRYNRMMQNTYTNPYSSAQNQRANYEVRKMDLYRDYELMDQDPIIASALDIYSDESTVDNIEGEIIGIKTENTKIREILHNLYYDIMNIEFNLWSWIRNLTKYGDFYLDLEIVDKYGVVNVKPISSYEILRLEEHDPQNPQLVQFEIIQRGAKELRENYEIAHFRLVADTNFLPYGIINKMKKIPVIDQKTGEYNLKYNIESVTEDYFLPVRGGDSGTEIDTLPGLSNNDQIDDIEYLKNKMMASLRIPKAFLGYEEGLSGGKATLAAEDVRFARTIERLQKIVISELTKIGIVHLYSQGFDNADLIDFDLELQNPSMIHEQEKLELMNQQIEAAEKAMETKLFSRKWVYDNIFDFSNDEKVELFQGLLNDSKNKFRFEQIESEGNDPATQPPPAPASGEQDQAMARKGDWGGSEKEHFKDDGPREDDGKVKKRHRSFGKREFKGGSPLAQSKGSTLVAHESMLSQLKKKFPKKPTTLLSEDNIIEE